MTSHSDRELMKMALNALEEAWEYGYTDPTVLNALRDRLAQPVHASDISQKCVDEMAKHKHEEKNS
jgi:hypothetical protein